MQFISDIQLFLSFESWQLAWTIPSKNISDTGILCHIDVHDEVSAQTAADLETLVLAEPTVRLQIDHTLPEVFTPVVWAKLVRCTREASGLALAFQFLEHDAHLPALMEHLTHSS